MTDARRIALDALTRITEENREVDDALTDAGIELLEGRERGFAYTLVMNSLRWGRAADALLATYIEKPIPERKHRALWALRMGVVQLLALGVPPHAAVSTTVTLIKKRKPDIAYAGMANAVLKKIAAEGKLDPLLALPEWMRFRWESSYGAETARAMAEAIMVEPPQDISLKNPLPSRGRDGVGAARGADLSTHAVAQAESGVHIAAPHPTSPLMGEEIGSITVRMLATDVTALPGYEAGEWWVQDVASTLPVQLLGEVRGKRVLDACAAPGGKTAQLCASGAEVTALDRSPMRLKRLAENMQRLGFTPEIVEADVMRWQPEALFEAILLDAPCSATGTLRRHPEIGWMRAETDMTKLAGIQSKLLAHAWGWLKPGGVMVYSVCSLEMEEGERQVERFLDKHKDATIRTPQLAEGAAPEGAISAEGYLRTLPHHWADKGGMDGFFAVALQKSPLPLGEGEEHE